MKDALYQVVNQVVHTEWEDANIMGRGTHHTYPKEGWRGKNLRINTSDLPHEHRCQNSNELLRQTTLQKPEATVGFKRLTGGLPA